MEWEHPIKEAKLQIKKCEQSLEHIKERCYKPSIYDNHNFLIRLRGDCETALGKSKQALVILEKGQMQGEKRLENELAPGKAKQAQAEKRLKNELALKERIAQIKCMTDEERDIEYEKIYKKNKAVMRKKRIDDMRKRRDYILIYGFKPHILIVGFKPHDIQKERVIMKHGIAI